MKRNHAHVADIADRESAKEVKIAHANEGRGWCQLALLWKCDLVLDLDLVPDLVISQQDGSIRLCVLLAIRPHKIQRVCECSTTSSRI